MLFRANVPATSIICIVSPSIGDPGNVKVNELAVELAKILSPADSVCEEVSVLVVTLSVPKDDTCRPILISQYYDVEVSIPNALADTLALEAYTTMLLPAFNITPVLSNTPFGPITASNSMNSAVVGVVEAASATLTLTTVVPLLHRLMLHTVNVLLGTVYNIVLAAAASAA
jgi:hypothetical protein